MTPVRTAMTSRRTSRRIRAWTRAVVATASVLLVALPAGCTRAAGTDTVTVLGIWTGAEEAEFRRVLAAFSDASGVRVVYTGARDAGNVLAADVREGEPPDLAVLPTPSDLNSYAGSLVGLDGVLDPAVVEGEYGPQWRNLMRDATGSYRAVIVKATLKSLIWYRPAALTAAGHDPPGSWAQLREVSDQLRTAGRPPWCLGLESSPSSGWPGTDWVEDILLHQAGPEAYQRWATGELAWTSPAVLAAWRTWGELVTPPGAVAGGPHAALVTPFGEAARPMFDDPPGCHLHHAASFLRGGYEAMAPGVPVGYLPFPAITPEHANTHVVAADLMVMFRDTPAARDLINFVATAEAQSIWPRAGAGAISVNIAVPADVYADELTRRTAAILTDPDARVAFDASDQMPAWVREAFNQAVLRYLAAPAELETILADLDRVRQQAYP